MATRDSEQARSEQDPGKVTQAAGALKSKQTDADDDPQRVNLEIDWRADESGGTKNEGADEDRLRDGN
jgi:hypothetical protein